jgi:programmed cell death 6-interacting protein
VLFNLGALYSQLATSEDRSTQEGIKRAIGHYQVSRKLLCHIKFSNDIQSAAGTFDFLSSCALSSLQFAQDDENIPLDLTESFVKSLEFLMLAQAQECVWQKAVMGQI